MSEPSPALQQDVAPSTCVEGEPFALQVLDRSMEPEFAPGCVVIIDPTGRLTEGAFVLVELPDQFAIRRLRFEGQMTILEPLNADFPVITRPCAPEAGGRGQAGSEGVIGVVVQRAGRRRREHKRYG